jgi:hypothetical protein
MRLHTSLSAAQVYMALKAARDSKAPGIELAGQTVHKSRTHPQAFEIRLAGPHGQKATWDDHGWFMAEVFKADPAARFAGAYDDQDDFDIKTKFAFADMSEYYPEPSPEPERPEPERPEPGLESVILAEVPVLPSPELEQAVRHFLERIAATERTGRLARDRRVELTWEDWTPTPYDPATDDGSAFHDGLDVPSYGD